MPSTLKPLSEEKEAKRQALYTVMCHVPYGEFFTHEAVGEILGEKPGTTRYYNLIAEVKHRLERRAKRTLLTKTGEGYKVALPHEYESVAINHNTHARWRINRQIQVLKATPDELLPPHDQRRHEATLMIAEEIRRHMLGVKKRSERLAQQPPQELPSGLEAQVAAAQSRIDTVGRPRKRTDG
jgi:hypothetical protein